MVDHGTRNTKGVHTIRDSCSHREKGAESEDVGRNGSKHVKGTINHQLQKFDTACNGNYKTCAHQIPNLNSCCSSLLRSSSTAKSSLYCGVK